MYFLEDGPALCQVQCFNLTVTIHMLIRYPLRRRTPLTPGFKIMDPALSGAQGWGEQVFGSEAPSCADHLLFKISCCGGHAWKPWPQTSQTQTSPSPAAWPAVSVCRAWWRNSRESSRLCDRSEPARVASGSSSQRSSVDQRPSARCSMLDTSGLMLIRRVPVVFSFHKATPKKVHKHPFKIETTTAPGYHRSTEEASSGYISQTEKKDVPSLASYRS